jgi:hypothetical protein
LDDDAAFNSPGHENSLVKVYFNEIAEKTFRTYRPGHQTEVPPGGSCRLSCAGSEFALIPGSKIALAMVNHGWECFPGFLCLVNVVPFINLIRNPAEFSAFSHYFFLIKSLHGGFWKDNS